MKKETIVVKNLKKSYSSKIVTDNISVTFYSGQIVALIGHNGAGKTTFLNQLNGLISSDSGSIQINGIDVTNHPNQARELVSSMPQFQVPIKGVTIQEAVECIGALKGMKKSDIQSSSNQLISYLNLEKWRHTTGEKLSGGLQRLTSFAMSVVDTPSIVILDEPTNDVDPYRRMLMWRHLRNLANQASTIIIVTHNLFEVERYADRYLMIDKGQVKKDVNVSDIQTQRNLRHQVSISILDEDTIVRFSQMDSCKYDNIEKRLTFTVKKEQLKEIVSIIMDLLEEDKIISYDLKLKNLSYDYEEYMNE
ncbi:MAG: ABC transporter ATP-binding protein [Gemella haemolysans]|jgi:ABC transport ATP-binding subunit|uniref:ABC transporter, ATP-binding protein n=1 Tax=Gemella haemolysans TaxID=1379 RepID=A0A133ZXL8_9BACL|nr:ABC transporter ATP-binding protein [Gemella haemolysans]KXB60184.1 ABC transporter, ATP-binding protein [Gemella haemolysans]MBS5319322.1 ABC transporter ATP-binding protein [Gemella haemolysans]